MYDLSYLVNEFSWQHWTRKEDKLIPTYSLLYIKKLKFSPAYHWSGNVLFSTRAMHGMAFIKKKATSARRNISYVLQYMIILKAP